MMCRVAKAIDAVGYLMGGAGIMVIGANAAMWGCGTKFAYQQDHQCNSASPRS